MTAYILLCCFTSCGLIYDKLEPCGDIEVTIVNDWSLNPEVKPEGMSYLFYEESLNDLWRFDFPGTQAGQVMLAEGHYRFVCFNDDSYNTYLSGDTYSTLKVSAWETRLPYDIGNGEKSVESPDMLSGCTYSCVRITSEGLTYVPSHREDNDCSYVTSPDNVLTAYIRQITPRYRLQIDDVENLSGVRSMSCALSGMSDSYIFSEDRSGESPVTMAFGVAAIGNSAIGGQFCTFGLPCGSCARNILYLFVTLKDGRAFVYRFDVTEQVREAPDPMSVLIKLRGLVLDAPDTTGGGFDVNVDGWITVDVNIDD